MILCFLLLLFPVSSAISFFEYETIPKNQEGGIGVGLPQGTGGEVSFEAHEFGTTVETIDVWVNGRNIGCIKVKMFDSENEPFTIGKQPDGNPTNTFTLVRGDTLTGDIVLSSNFDTGAPARIGYIQFKTKGGKDFSVGDPGGPDYRFPSGESYLTGFHGLNDGLVHALGLYMMKPYPESKLVVDQYFTKSLKGIPVKLEGGSFTNPSLEPITQTFTVTKRTSTTNEWSVENSFGFTFGTSIEASIPEVGGITTSYEINFSTSSTQTNTKYVEEEVSQRQFSSLVLPAPTPPTKVNGMNPISQLNSMVLSNTPSRTAALGASQPKESGRE